jgi:hypothetical protein
LEVGGSERRKFKPWITTNLFGDLSPPEAGPGRKKKIHYTGKIDVYFLGIAMLEVATTEKKGGVLRYLWPGDYYSPEETAGRLPDSQPLKQVILKCLQPNPEERIRSSDVHHYLLQKEMEISFKIALSNNAKVAISITRILFIGLPKVGKSSLKHLLVKNKPKAIQLSTALMEAPDIVRVTSDQYLATNNSSWEELKDRSIITSTQAAAIEAGIILESGRTRRHSEDRLDEENVSTLPTSHRSQSLATTSSRSNQTSTSYLRTRGVIEVPVLNPIIEGKSTENLRMRRSSSHRLSQQDTLKCKYNEDSKDMLKSAYEAAIQKSDVEPTDFKLENSHFVHILDTGGQPCFHDVLACFLDAPCTYALVFKGSTIKRVCQPASITYRYADKAHKPQCHGKGTSLQPGASKKPSGEPKIRARNPTEPEGRENLKRHSTRTEGTNNIRHSDPLPRRVCHKDTETAVPRNSSQMHEKGTERGHLDKYITAPEKGQLNSPLQGEANTRTVSSQKTRSNFDSGTKRMEVHGCRRELGSELGSANSFEGIGLKSVVLRKESKMEPDDPPTPSIQTRMNETKNSVKLKCDSGSAPFDVQRPELEEGSGTETLHSKSLTSGIEEGTRSSGSNINVQSEIQHSTMECSQTELEMLHCLCSTVQIMKRRKFETLTTLLPTHVSPKPQICLIGTFKDEISDLPAARGEIQAVLHGCLKSRALINRVIKDKESLYFLLNTLQTMDDPEHAECIDRLRRSISSNDSAIKIDIPITWHMLQQISTRISPCFIQYGTLKAFAIEKKFFEEHQDSNFRCFVHVFHILGLFVYYDLDDITEDDNWICTDATVFYRYLSALLTIQFRPNDDLKEASQDFKKKGQIDYSNDSTASQCKVIFENLGIGLATMHQEWFLHVLCHTGIAAELKSKSTETTQRPTTHHPPRTFLVPAALPERLQVPGYTHPRSFSPLCTAIKIQESEATDPQCVLPQGLYTQLVAKVLDKWELVRKWNNTRGSIKFLYNNALIHLTEADNWIETTVCLQEPFCKEGSQGVDAARKFCTDICKFLCSSIEDIFQQHFPEAAGRKSKVICGFICKCNQAVPHIAEVHHASEEDEANLSMVCIGGDKIADQFQTLSEEQCIWFTASPKIQLENMEMEKQSHKMEEGHTVKFWTLTKKPLPNESDLLSSKRLSRNQIYDAALVRTNAAMRCKISLSGLLPLLEEPAGGFMTIEDKQEVEAETVEHLIVDKIFAILRKKDIKAFYSFLEILRLSGNTICADVLQENCKCMHAHFPCMCLT